MSLTEKTMVTRFKVSFLNSITPYMKMDTSPFGKGGTRGIFQVDSLLNPPWPPFSKG